MMVSMDDVGGRLDGGEVVDHGDTGRPQRGCYAAQQVAVGDRLVAAGEQRGRDVEDVELRAGARRERVVGEEDAQGGLAEDLEHSGVERAQGEVADRREE
jgi:hypothetical protein